MDVHAEDQLAAGDVLHLVDERAIAITSGDPLAFEETERMRSGGPDPQALVAGNAADVAADLAELIRDLAGRVAYGRRDLEHRLHQLRVDHGLELVPRDRGEHRVDVLHEVERLGVQEHVFLLDAERVRVTLAEGVIQHAASRREPRALPGDRRRVNLLAIHDGSLTTPGAARQPRSPQPSEDRGTPRRRAW